MNSFIRLNGVSKTFDNHQALASIDVDLPLGKMIGLVGPDGSGKTTLIRLLAGLLTPTTGTILIGGIPTDQIQGMIGYMPQRFGLYEDLTVEENLKLYADLKGVEHNFDSLLTFTGLSPFTNRLAKNLSGGMKQKLGLSCALMKKPKLLLLDEPSVGVDPLSRRELWEMVYSLLAEDIAIIWSTAYLDEAEKCDEVLLLNEGNLRFLGKPQDLTQKVEGKVFRLEHVQDKRLELRRLMKLDGVLDGVIEGSSLRLVLSHPIDGVCLVPTKPRFEDAFVDLLSGRQQAQEMMFHPSKGLCEYPIVADGLSKQFGSFVAASKVSFRVKRGEIFGLLGPNGAGKSTTFKMLCGLLKASQGRALINGRNVSYERGSIGYMAQKFSLYGNLTVLQNLEFFGSLYCKSQKEKKEALDRIIEIFDLTDFLHQICDRLPIGFKQRLSFAAATLHCPEVLFLDEPTSGMDPMTRRAFWRQISQLAIDGCTIMVTTHFMDEAENCDQIALLYQGKIIHLGTSDELKMQARSENNPHPTLDDAFIQLIEANRVDRTPF